MLWTSASACSCRTIATLFGLSVARLTVASAAFLRPSVTSSVSLISRSTRTGTTVSPFLRRPLSTTLAMTSLPPSARREEDRVVYCGVAHSSEDSSKAKLPRQSEGSTEALLDPPVAVPDPYGWMRDESRSNQEVLDHLKAENAYTEDLTQHLAPLRTKLYEEMLGYLQETDYAVPRPRDDWWYYTRTFEGKSYPVHCRAPKHTNECHVDWDGAPTTPILTDEQVLLDENQLAQGKDYCATGSVKTSPSHNLLAYTVDFVGGEICQLQIVNATTKKVLFEDASLEIYGSLVWGADDDTIYYLKMDAAKRPYQVYRRNLQTNTEELLWEEPNELYWVSISKSLDGQYLLVNAGSMETTEVWYLDLLDKNSKLQCVAKRRPKVLYDVEHRQGHFWITSNVGGTPNLRLWTCPVGPNGENQWKEVTLEDKPLFDGGYDRVLKYLTCLSTHVVAEGREGGIPRVWILQVDEKETAVKSFAPLQFEEDAHDVGLGTHYEFDTSNILVSYDSLITPLSHIEIDLQDTSQRTVVKEKNVPNYDKAKYGCDRITVKSRDGTTEIPVSIVYRQDVMDEFKTSGKPVHVHLYGYGSYESCVEADFRATRLPLLERGIVYVLAHIRGGGEMGRQWYEEPNGAKYLCKKNTFNDFVDVAKYFVQDKKLTTPSLLSCEGRSAGGLLIGASVNQAPHLFQMAILGVPFVDVVCTMTDASIPLTTGEWEEWGNPNEKKFHDYMMEYSPINNVKPGAKYPSMLLTGGLHDPRVQYWEPAKMAAQLRHLQDSSSSGPVCVKMDMAAGHFSASDRYKYLKELAFDYAFMLDQVGLADKVDE